MDQKWVAVTSTVAYQTEFLVPKNRSVVVDIRLAKITSKIHKFKLSLIRQPKQKKQIYRSERSEFTANKEFTLDKTCAEL
jgi:hypothetical protein